MFFVFVQYSFFSTRSQFFLSFIWNDFRAFSSHHYLYVILYFIFFGKFSRFYYLLNTFQSNKNKKKTKAKLKPRPFFHCWVLQSYDGTTEFQPFKHFSTSDMAAPKPQLQCCTVISWKTSRKRKKSVV